jgi:hypothetical protein
MQPTYKDMPLLMPHLVAVRPESAGKILAWAASFPELRAVAATEQEAIDQVKQLLTGWFASTRFVEVQVPTPRVFNPSLKFAGHLDPNDPMEQAYLEELARMKREDLENTLREYEQECSSSSSTPTT